MAEVTKECVSMCKDIIRISGGGTETTFGDLCKDDIVENRYEALLGTLKAARKRGLLTFQGELLLFGQHNDTVIALTELGAETAANEPDDDGVDKAASAAQHVVEGADEEGHVQEEDEGVASGEPPPHAEPASDATAQPAAEAGEAAAEETPAAAEEEQPPASPSTSMMGFVTSLFGGSAAPAEAPASASAAPPAEPEDPMSPSSQGDDEARGKWKVDTGYIDHRTADPDRTAGRRSVQPAAEGSSSLPSGGAANATKGEDGKWTAVDVSYIDHRTSTVDNLQIRSGDAAAAGESSVGPSTVSAMTRKESDGKWKVDTSYINHRTDQTENLEARQAELKQGASSDAATPSATVKKDSDGKWKVDMGYIDYRTVDTANRTKNQEEVAANNYSDPKDKKYAYEELRGMGNRPDDVDPKWKELYLTEADFETVFGMTHDAFAKLPKWKQQNLKKATEVF